MIDIWFKLGMSCSIAQIALTSLGRLLSGYLIRLRVTKENDAEYLSAFLNTAYSKRMLRSMGKTIIGMANINATEIQAMRIARPSPTLQREFAVRVMAVERLKVAYRSSLKVLDELFTALQLQAFRGEL
jgi:type I restriction enzyme, S subunit